MSNWIDTHAHIYLEEFAQDRTEMIERALEVGVGKIYMPNIDHQSVDAMMETEWKNPDRCFSMMGLHPCSVKKDFQKELYIVENWLSKRSFTAVGEMGTDLYWDKTFWDQQKEAFIIQANWAKRYKLPLIIHCRESIGETIDLLKPLVDRELTGIFHCFTGTAEQAKTIIDMGFYLGIGGVSTFRNGGLDKIIPELPMDKIVLETDSPYLAPVPHRGKRNEPSYLAIIAARISELKETTLDVVQESTSRNAEKLFINTDSLSTKSELNR